MKPIKKKQLYIFVKINFLILALFVVIVLINNLKKQELSKTTVETFQLEERKVKVIK